MIYQILELHKKLTKGQTLKIIALGEYTTHLNKSDIVKPTKEAQVLQIHRANGNTIALNCNHIIVACITEVW